MMTKYLENPVAALLLVVAIAIACGLIVIKALQPSTDRAEWQEVDYLVKSGDSLWGVAGNYCPRDVDRRDWIREVRELNDLHDSTIYPGQIITVLAPAEEE